MTDDGIPMKRCSKCGEAYPATAEYFYRRSNVPSGLQAHCKACNKKYMVAYYIARPEALAANRQRNRERMNRRYRDDPEYRARDNKAGNARDKADRQNPEKRPQLLERQNARFRTEAAKAKRRARMRERRLDEAYRKDRQEYQAAYYERHRDEISKRVAAQRKVSVLRSIRLYRHIPFYKQAKRPPPDEK